MKRLVLLASLCVVAVVLVPVASASAARLTGTCVLKGTATFGGPLSAGLPTKNTYTFVSESAPNGASCAGVNEKNEPETLTGSAQVSGSGELACAVAEGGTEGEVNLLGKTGAPGSGTLTLAATTYGFKLKFHAVAGNVLVETNGEVKANGDAEFLTDPEGVLACGAGKAEKLKFTATVTGTVG